MLMPTFLQMSQRYVLVTVEWQKGVKIKRNQKKKEKGIKCTEKSLASWLLSLIYERFLKIIKQERCLSKGRSNLELPGAGSSITGALQKITRKPQKLFTALQSGIQTEDLYQMYGRVIRICD